MPVHAPLPPGILEARRCVGQEPWKPPYASIGALLARRASSHPDRVYLVFFDDELDIERRWTYGELAAAVGKAATFLRRQGIVRGRRIALLTGNLDYTIVLYLAAWSIGACATPLNAAETPERKAFILDHSRAQLLLARSEHLREARRLVRDREIGLVEVAPSPEAAEGGGLPRYPDDAADLAPLTLSPREVRAVESEALLVYTSGTTGDAKGVLLDQANLMADCDAMASWHRYSAATRALCVLPVHHVNGLIVSHLTPLYVGGSTVLCARFSTRTFWSRVVAERVTTVSLVPTLLQFLMEADTGDRPDTALESVLCGAGPLRVDAALEFEERFGVPLIHGYGLSETTGYNCQLPIDLAPTERRAWLSEHGFPSIGCALPHQQLSIRREDGQLADACERGEICVRGDVVSRGYLGRPEANETAFRHGWFHTGDEGFALPSPDGRTFYFITGRMKELIIRGGVNYSPLEIDEILTSHPDVQFGLALPFENRYYGEEVAAYVVPRPGADPSPEKLVEWCRDRLGFERSPKVILLGDNVPYTTTGKPKRIELARILEPRLEPYRDVQFRK